MRDPPSPSPPEPPQSNSGVILALVAIALILAISFFYLTNERRQDRQADAVTDAAASVGASTLRNQTPCLGVTNAPLAMRSASATVAFFHRRFENWKWQRKYSSPAGPKRRPPSKRQ